jgi:transcriptional regulator with PAS, ATPase and Fis domain
MREVRQLITRMSQFPGVPVLITGETGTGKELVVNALHDMSNRCDRLLEKINCSAIPDQLFESQLFGHRKGAFTGATIAQKGLVELADGGTLFLDEISQMKLDLQTKLLRFLEDGTFLPVGETEERCSKTWIIAATNKRLEELIDNNLFRSALYYRLKGIEINLPPLRERREDILPLAQHFIKEFTNDFNLEQIKLTSRAQEMFLAYHWPGNVRELRNKIRALIVTGDENLILRQNFPPEFTDNAASEEYAEILSLDEVEREHIQEVFRRNNGRIRKTARDLRTTPQTLRKKLKSYMLSNIFTEN